MNAFYTCRKALEAADRNFTLYEHKGVSLPLRFMVENHIVPMGWVRMKKNAALERSRVNETRCAENYVMYEFSDAAIESLSGDLGHPALDENLANTVAPIRTVWFDIECVSNDKAFPKPETAQVIMIGVLSAEASEIRQHVIFHLETITALDSDPDGRFVQCANEKELIGAFAKFVADFDADLVGGYNSGGFDFPFLFHRAEFINCEDELESFLSRVYHNPAKLKTTHFESSAHGKRDSYTVDLHGRASYDLLEIIRREYRGLSTYTLNAVSEHFLGDHKADVHHSMIPILFQRSPEDRRRLAQYCLKDVLLPFQVRVCAAAAAESTVT